MKICSDCQVEKPLDAFYVHKMTKDRRYPYCKECGKARAREWKRAHPQHGERYQLGEQGLRRCKQCNEIKPLDAEHFLVVKGVITSPCRACLGARRKAAYTPKARKAAQGRNPDVRWISRKAGKARKAGATVVDLTLAQWAALKELYDFRCAYCGDAVPVLTIDHIQALARGGQHTASNVVPACLGCNQRKHDGPPPADFVQRELNVETSGGGGSAPAVC